MKTFVLIVDDEFGLADVVAHILTDDGFDVAVAINGELGLARLAERRADVVLLDVMMPVLDGPGMLAKMRSTSAFEDIPVIMMTALPEGLAEIDPATYQTVLLKPYKLPQLYEALGKVGIVRR